MKDEIYNSEGFGVRLRQARYYRGISKQTIVCKMLNISRATWSMWELGKRFPHFTVLVKIANYLKIRIDYFSTKYAKPEDYDLLPPGKDQYEIPIC